MKRLEWLVLTAVLLHSSTAYTKDGNYLLASCDQVIDYLTTQSKQSRKNGEFCIGVTAGAMNMESIFKKTSHYKRAFCIPKDVKRVMQMRIIVKFLNNHPERLGEEEVTLVNAAFKDAFPCNK